MAVADWSAVATDDYNRSNGAIGANYEDGYGGVAPEVESNQLVSGSSGNDGSAEWTADSFNNDQYSEIEVTDDTNGEHYVGVNVRMADVVSGGDMYTYWTDGDAETGCERIDDDSATSLQSGMTDPNINEDMAIEIIGTTIRFYIERAEVDTPETDATY